MVKRGFVIGINYLDNENARLFGCINDAITMQNLMIDAFGYSKSNITMLRDDNILGYDSPTKLNIIQELNRLVDINNENDELWIHYSGHGAYVSDLNGDEYDRKDEIIIPSDYKQNGIIVDDELREIFNRSKGLIYITLDCCNSGTGWDLPFLFRNINNSLYRFNMNSEMSNKNIYMLSGCRDNQYAMDTFNQEIDKPIGAFTNAFVECSRFHNHNVSLIQLHKDINLYFKTNGFSQICELTSSNPNPSHVRITRSNITIENKILNQNNINNLMRNIIY